MSSNYFGVFVSDPWLQNQFTQVELRTLKSHFLTMRRDSGSLTLADLPSKMSKLKNVGENLTEEERVVFLHDSYQNLADEVDFELFLRVYLNLQAHATSRMGKGAKNSSAFLKSPTSTLLHTISESEKASYVGHINNYLGEDNFLKKFLPIDPSTNDLFELCKRGVLILVKLINVAVPGTIDERAINTKTVLNPWERNENHTLVSIYFIAMTLNANLTSIKDISPMVANMSIRGKIQKLQQATRHDFGKIDKDTIVPDLDLEKTPQLDECVADNQVMEHSFTYLLKGVPLYEIFKDPLKRATLVLEHTDKMGCKRYLTAKYIVEVLDITLTFIKLSAHRWVLLEALDKVSPGIVNWKIANKPPIKMPFRKVENCNQVVKIGKQLKFSLVNIAGNDILLKYLRSYSTGKEFTDADILDWANTKVRSTGSQTCMKSFKDKSLSDGIFFLELLSAVQPRVVNWRLVTKGQTEEEKQMNATYIISIARKIGCSIFLLPEDIIEVNQKMILTLTASIMYWFFKQPMEDQRPCGSSDSDSGNQLETSDDTESESSTE
ncbi:fimbrin-2 [Tanacetum coccineum]